MVQQPDERSRQAGTPPTPITKLSLEECRSLVDDPSLSDDDILSLRDDLYIFIGNMFDFLFERHP